jgi:hypothetical protein
MLPVLKDWPDRKETGQNPYKNKNREPTDYSAQRFNVLRVVPIEEGNCEGADAAPTSPASDGPSLSRKSCLFHLYRSLHRGDFSEQVHQNKL